MPSAGMFRKRLPVYAYRYDGPEPLVIHRRQGLCPLPSHAQFEDGSVGVEAGVLEMLERMQSGRWRVFHPLAEWFEEFRLYHRKEGRLVKLADDLLSASRYAMMMRRFAEPAAGPRLEPAARLREKVGGVKRPNPPPLTGPSSSSGG